MEPTIYTFTIFIFLLEKVEEALILGKVHDIIYKNGITFQIFTTKEYNIYSNCYFITETMV